MPHLPDRGPPLVIPSAPPRWWIGVVYVALFGLSVPWYLPAVDPVPLWLGLPFWVVLAVAGNVAVALFTALVVVRTWPRDPDVPPSPRERADG